MRSDEKGFGTNIAVLPEYVDSNGNDAIVGSNNLYRHFRSKVSSIKPRNIMKHIENKPVL